MKSLLIGEFWLTADVIFGLTFAYAIMRLDIAGFIMRRILSSLPLPADVMLAVGVSFASSKAGAAIISSSLERNEISEPCAIWSTLMLPFPSYIRRWPATVMFAFGTAGVAGTIFACSLLLRSLLRFLIALFMTLKHSHARQSSIPQKIPLNKYSLLRSLRGLPIAWLTFGLSYSLVPIIESYFRASFSGWIIVATSITHVKSALTISGSLMKAGTISVVDAIFSLILGSGLGTSARILRTNAGYYYGLFPRRIATRLLLLNFATIMPLIALNLLFAAIALSLCS